MTDPQPDEQAIIRVARNISDPAIQAEYLRQVCAGDVSLHRRMEALLANRESESPFLPATSQPVSTSDPNSAGAAPGQEIGRYRLLQRIGEGGFGIVYMAEQQRPVRRRVAVKIIKPGMDTHTVVARFEAERQTLALMDHPNISRVLDGGATDNGRPYFVMELVQGVPITEYCDKNCLSARDRLRLFVTVCLAIQHAHQKGIIHRDLKPSNILVTHLDGRPVVKVIDFGIAKAINQQLTEKTLFTAVGQMVGTPQYMSPEQAEMTGLDVDTRSDIYSLGVVLYELLTGATPLGREQLRDAGYAELQRLICEEEPVKPSTRLSGCEEPLALVAKRRSATPDRLLKLVRGDLDWIVMTAIEKDRTRRYPTATGFAEDIQRFLSHEPIHARPPSAMYRISKLTRRHRLMLTAVVLVVCSLVGGLVTALRAARISQIARERLAQEVAEKQVALESLANTAIADAVMAALAGNDAQAHKAIDTARSASAAPPYVIQVVQALLALNDGDYGNAIRLADEILASPPPVKHSQQLAARAILVPANAFAFDWVRAEHEQLELRKLTPETDMDRVLRSYALVLMDPAEVLNDAYVHSEVCRSPVGVLIRGQARFYLAIDKQDVALLDTALNDLEYAQFLLGDSRHAMAFRVAALGHAIELARQFGRVEDVTRYIDRGNATAATLAAADYPLGHFDSWLFWRAAGDEVRAAESLDRTVRHGGGYSIYLAADCLKCADPMAGKTRFEMIASGFREHSPLVRIAQAHVEHALSGNENAVRELVGNLVTDPSPIVARHALLALCLVARSDEIAARAQEAVAATLKVNDIWGGPHSIQFLAHEMDERQLLELVANRVWRASQAHFTIAMYRLADGDQADSLHHLRACVATNAFGSFDYELARAYLARLDDNTTSSLVPPPAAHSVN